MRLTDLRRFIAPLQNRIQMTVSRAIVRVVNDAVSRQEVQVTLLAGETRDGLEHYLPYGFTSHPEPGAEGVALFVGGNRDHGFVIVVDDRRHRPTGQDEGESGLYNRAGIRIRLRDSGDLEIDAPGDVTVTAVGKATVTGATVDITSAGAVTIDGSATSIEGKDFLTHTHVGSPSAPAGGVTNTGAVV